MDKLYINHMGPCTYDVRTEGGGGLAKIGQPEARAHEISKCNVSADIRMTNVHSCFSEFGEKLIYVSCFKVA